MKKPLLFVLAAAIQIIAMLSIAARYSYVETTGDTVYIPAVGFDPRDMFRGDYANVSYGDLALWTGAVNFDVTQGKRVYVTPEFTASGEIVAIRNVTQSAPDVRYVQAKVASFTYEHPKYGYASELSSSAVPISGTMENEREWISDYSPSASKSENAPQTKFSV